jgi:hypothetical protein
VFTSRRRSRYDAIRFLALAALVGAAVAPGARGDVVHAQSSPSLLGQDGRAWRALSEGEKLALLTGFLVGGALEQSLGPAPGTEAPDLESLERLRREGRLRFPFAPTVYKARLEDFYVYQDRLDVPLYRALFLINEQLRRGGR